MPFNGCEAADATSLVFIGHHKGDVGPVGRREPIVTAYRDDLIAKHGDKRHAVLIVDGGEMLHFSIAELALGCEETQVHALRRELGEERAICRRVVRSYGTNVHGAAVAEYGIHLPVGRVLVCRRLSRVHFQTRVPDADIGTRL